MKGMALTQIVLTIVISSIVSISIFSYYKATTTTEATAKTKAQELAKSKPLEIGVNLQEGFKAGLADMTDKDVGSIDLAGAVDVANSVATVNLSSRSGSFSETSTKPKASAPIGGGSGGSVSGGVVSPGLGEAPASSVGPGDLKKPKPKLATCGSPCSAVGGYAGWWTGGYINGKPLCVSALPYCEPDPPPQSCPWTGGGSAPANCQPVSGGWSCSATVSKPAVTYKCK